MKKTITGFTIVELLIVIVVIAVLAAITIVAFNGVQQRARASGASSAIAQAKKKLALYQVDNSAYPMTGNLNAAGVSNSNSVYYQYTSDGTTYCITASISGDSYSATNNSEPASGACSGQVVGGTITNLNPNPSVETSLSQWGAADTAGSSSTLARVTTTAYSGSASGQFTLNTLGTNASYPRWYTSNIASSIPAGSYTASVMAKGPAGSYAKLTFTGNSNGATIADGPVIALSPSSWVALTVSVTTTSAGDTRLVVRPTGSSGNTTDATLGNYYMDSGMLTSGTAYFTYADGSSPNWVWNGSANASTSTGPPL